MHKIAGWSSLVARQAHNLKVLGSNPSPATKFAIKNFTNITILFFYLIKNKLLNKKKLKI